MNVLIMSQNNVGLNNGYGDHYFSSASYYLFVKTFVPYCLYSTCHMYLIRVQDVMFAISIQCFTQFVDVNYICYVTYQYTYVILINTSSLLNRNIFL